MVEEGKFRVEKFNVQNYQLWKMQMKDYLCQKDLYLPLDEKRKQPATIKDEEWEVLDRKVLGKVQSFLASLVAFDISREKIIEVVMSTLAKLYEKPSTSNKAFLMKVLFNRKISDGGSIVDHLNEFNMVTNLDLCMNEMKEHTQNHNHKHFAKITEIQ